MIREHKIPTILGFLILILGLAAGVFLVQQGQVFFLRAAPEITPTQVKITNISSSSFSISWLTEKETNGFIKFGQTPSLEQTVSDDRDQISGPTGSFLTHHVSLKNLKPKTVYFFKIGSQNRLFDDSGKPYQITTAASPPGSSPPSDVASGTVLDLEGKPAEGAIVYLSIVNMTPQSALVGTGGNWFISLNTAFSTSLATFANYDKQAQVEEIFIQGGQNLTATVITTTGNDNPVPEIILGKNYDFRREAPSGATPTGQPSPTSSKFSFEELATPKAATEGAEITITNPREKEKINTPKPEFRGTGPADKTIQILVESPSLRGTVLVGNDGNWTWTPPASLSPDEHKITITYLGQTLTRTFTVLAAGASELPAFTATPSATLTPTPTPKLTPTLNPTPTATPSARTGMPSTQAGVPQPGNLTPTFLVFIMGLILILTGFVTNKLLAHDR